MDADRDKFAETNSSPTVGKHGRWNVLLRYLLVDGCRIVIYGASESALVFSYDKLDLIWPLCANEVIKAELDQMERISVKWSESQYLPSLSALPASFEQLHGAGREEQKRSSRDRQILLRLQRRAIVLKKLARIKISVAFFLSSWFIGIWPAIQPTENVPNLSMGRAKSVYVCSHGPLPSI